MPTSAPIKVKVFDTSVTPASYILSDAFRYSHLVLASTTYNAGIFVTMENLIHDIVNHNLQGRKIALLENGSWAAASGRLMKEELSKLRGTEFIGETVSLKSDITEPQLAELDALADAIAADIRPVVAVTAEPVEAGALNVDNKVFNKFSYGVSPYDGKTGEDLGLKPVMTLKSNLIAVRKVRKGDKVGYGATWTASRDTRLGIVAMGYGDGYPRQAPNGTPVLINGRIAGTAGHVCMDMMAIDLGPDSTDRVGDEVILWGRGLPTDGCAVSHSYFHRLFTASISDLNEKAQAEIR